MKLRIYIASPFFNTEQEERIGRVENAVVNSGCTFFSPRFETYVPADSTHQDRLTAFTDNIEAIEECDIVLVVTDGKDVGTLFEAGFAYGIGKPILYYAETLGDKPFNLMLAMSGAFGVCRSIEELKAKLDVIIRLDRSMLADINALMSVEFNGAIE